MFAALAPAGLARCGESWVRTGVALTWGENADSVQACVTRGLALLERARPTDSLALALGWHTLGLLDYRYHSDPVGARAWTERSLGVRRRILGPDHAQVAASHLQLGNVALRVRDLERAESDYREAARILRGVPRQQGLAVAINNLASLLEQRGRYREARSGFLEVLELYRRDLGPRHPNVAFTLANIAGNLFEDARMDSARRVVAAAESVYREHFPPVHREFARIHNIHAAIARRSGRFDEALARYVQEGVVRDSVFGPGHPSVAQNRYRQALAHADLGLAGVSFDLALSAEEAGVHQAAAILRGLPGREGLGYVQRRPGGMDLALTLLADGWSTRSREHVERAWSAVLRTRGLVIEEEAWRRRWASGASDSTTRARWVRYGAACADFASVFVKGSRAGAGGRAEVARADSLLREREREFVQASRLAVTEGRNRAIPLAAIVPHLPGETALVAYVRYRPVRYGRAAVENFGRPAPEERFLAFVQSSASEDPRVVPLAAAASVDSLVAAWRAEVSDGAATSASERRARSLGTAIASAIWEPVARQVATARRVWIVPASTLHLLPFAALPRADGGHLVEDERVLHILSSEKDILPGEEAKGEGMVAFGGIDYEQVHSGGESARGEDGGRSPTTADPAGFRGRSPPCIPAGRLELARLPWSAVEVEDIERIWRSSSRAPATPSIRLTGAAASESRLRASAPGHEFLHLATHGIYVSAACSTGGSGGSDDLPALALSAVALAGANRSTPDSDGHDGLLTAEEVATLDLRGTAWVVLSGCNTGVGPIDAWEGVFGLRRAFRVAGARTLILSLWPVPDADTRLWMRGLYEARLGQGLATDDSVRQACLVVLGQRRRNGYSTHPATWAAFVASGAAR